jgi:DnaJ-class molecular chaperone
VRNGDDLSFTHTISLLEALVGFSHSVAHLDGHEFTITRSVVTKHGFVLVLPKEGMPQHTTPSTKGALHVTFHVDFPSSLTEHQKQGIKKLL